MKTLVAGLGEVGSALLDVLSTAHEVYGVDTNRYIGPTPNGITVLNICFPWTPGFAQAVDQYRNWHRPALTIIHSTVPVGATRLLGGCAVASPVRGTHPDLKAGLLAFPKWCGGLRHEDAESAARFFDKAGIPVHVVDQPETAELAKLLDTAYYAWNIVFEKEVHALCRQHRLPFEEVYQRWNEEYNAGYAESRPEVRRPVLKHAPGAIGGHCLIPNARFLDSWLTRTLLERNLAYEERKT